MDKDISKEMAQSISTNHVIESVVKDIVVGGDSHVDASGKTDNIEEDNAQAPVNTSDPEHDALEATETGRGRPPHLPNEDTRKQVYDLSSVGTLYEDIAKVIGISQDTLTKYYRPELDRGRIDANAIIAGTLFKQAQEGNTSAMIFWLKTRARWKEVTQHEVSGNPDGTPIQVKVITGIE